MRLIPGQTLLKVRLWHQSFKELPALILISFGLRLNECTTHHEKCKEVVSAPWFPSRLLYVGSQGREVKLIISEYSPPNGPYMTLSHRWGPQTYTKLQSSTMVQLQNGIDIVSLPQVFQDAIKIACLLGINYLWIDALCIKRDQDDLSDWEVESQNMGKVYSRAFLNVSATLSQDGSESLFHQQGLGPILPSEIELEVDGLLQKYYVFDSNMWSDEITDAPLNHRGWVFQERVLARRVLHFGQRQMGWECNELDALEVFPKGLPRLNAMSFMPKSNIGMMMTAPTQRPSQTLDTKFIEQWQNLVNSYSKCKLTYSKDKLIAFSGIAKGIMATRTDRYLAGMWASCLVYDLAWMRYYADCKAFPISATSSRAPSWSWASVDGEINFPSLNGGVKAVFADIQGLSDPAVEESSAIGVPSSIRAKGICLPVDIEWLNEEEIARFKVMRFRFNVNDGPLLSNMDLEVSNKEVRDLVQQGNLLLMPLFATAYFLNAILLAKIRRVGSHGRVGAVEIEVMKDGSNMIRDEKRNGTDGSIITSRGPGNGVIRPSKQYQQHSVEQGCGGLHELYF